MSLLLCLNPKTRKSAGKKLKGKGAEDILELAAPITKYVPSTRTEVSYRVPRHDSLSPTGSAADCGDYNRSQQSNDSGQSFQSKSSGYASGYMTDDSTTTELRRATQGNPASVIMAVVKDYRACCGEEMTVKKGQRVKVMYRQGDWAYAVSKHGGKGFIPYSFVRTSRKYAGSGYTSEPDGPSRRHLSGYETDPGISSRVRQRLDSCSTITSMQSRSASRKDVRYTSPMSRNFIREETPSGYMSECVFSPSAGPRQSRSTRPSPTTYFKRSFIEKLVVLHDFTATDEDEVVVTKGEEVRVLNADDASWLWVQTACGREGYVPRNCLPFGTHPALQRMTAPISAKVPMRRPHRVPQHQLPHHLRSQSASRAQREYAKQQFRQLALAQHNPAKIAVCQTKEEIKRIGTRLLVLSNYEPLQSDELQVELGEMVLADVLTQSNVKRVWAYCPRLDQVGYLPVWVVHPPIL